MARRFISDLGPGEFIENQTFLVASKDLRTTTQGSLYIHAVLADKTGQLLARVWQASEAMYKVLPEGGFIDLKGRCESYKGSLQFIIEAIRPVEEKNVDIGEFLPRTERDIDEMWASVKTILDKIKEPSLAAIVADFVADQDRIDLFKIAPAAISMHHAYVGGLLEHTLSLMELAELVVPRYPKLSLDLVRTGLFLHDFGKTAELGYRTNFHYTDPGQLLGHISICVLWIEQAAARVAEKTGKPFPDRTKWLLQHIVLSHHAKPEFGSPKYPAIPEALAIHFLDNLDAKLEMSLAAIANDKDDQSTWTSYQRALDTKLYKPSLLDGAE